MIQIPENKIKIGFEQKTNKVSQKHTNNNDEDNVLAPKNTACDEKEGDRKRERERLHMHTHAMLRGWRLRSNTADIWWTSREGGRQVDVIEMKTFRD